MHRHSNGNIGHPAPADVQSDRKEAIDVFRRNCARDPVRLVLCGCFGQHIGSPLGVTMCQYGTLFCENPLIVLVEQGCRRLGRPRQRSARRHKPDPAMVLCRRFARRVKPEIRIEVSSLAAAPKRRCRPLIILSILERLREALVAPPAPHHAEDMKSWAASQDLSGERVSCPTHLVQAPLRPFYTRVARGLQRRPCAGGIGHRRCLSRGLTCGCDRRSTYRAERQEWRSQLRPPMASRRGVSPGFP